MPHLSITHDDATVLRELLEAARMDLVRELTHTDSREFRQALLERDRAFERLLEEVRQDVARQLQAVSSVPGVGRDASRRRVRVGQKPESLELGQDTVLAGQIALRYAEKTAM